MTSEKRGLCIIISNEHFKAESHFNRRPGAVKDAAMLHEVFTKLSFDVRLYRDVTAHQALLALVQGWWKTYVWNTCMPCTCFMCWILSKLLAINWELCFLYIADENQVHCEMMIWWWWWWWWCSMSLKTTTDVDDLSPLQSYLFHSFIAVIKSVIVHELFPKHKVRWKVSDVITCIPIHLPEHGSTLPVDLHSFALWHIKY